MVKATRQSSLCASRSAVRMNRCFRTISRTTHRIAFCSPARPQQLRVLKQTNRATSSDKDLPPPDVRKLAQLAHLSVTDQQVEEWEPQLQSILGWFAQLQQTDVSGVQPAVRADTHADSVLRDDLPVEYDNRKALLAEVPVREGAFVKVPKIM